MLLVLKNIVMDLNNVMMIYTICDKLEKVKVENLDEVWGAQVNMWNVSFNQELESYFQFCIQVTAFAP